MHRSRTPAWLAAQLEAHGALAIAGAEVSRAAVALVFDPSLNLLFIRRSERVGDPWSGHMAFPGGRVDPGDPDPRGAALRETWEEVGVDLRSATFVGPLDELASPVRTGRRRLVISPFVWQLSSAVQTVPNEEVAQTHWFALDRLLAGEGRDTFSFPWGKATVPLPVVRLDGTEIWGITLRIVEDLLRRLQGKVPPRLH